MVYRRPLKKKYVPGGCATEDGIEYEIFYEDFGGEMHNVTFDDDTHMIAEFDERPVNILAAEQLKRVKKCPQDFDNDDDDQIFVLFKAGMGGMEPLGVISYVQRNDSEYEKNTSAAFNKVSIANRETDEQGGLFD